VNWQRSPLPLEPEPGPRSFITHCLRRSTWQCQCGTLWKTFYPWKEGEGLVMVRRSNAQFNVPWMTKNAHMSQINTSCMSDVELTREYQRLIWSPRYPMLGLSGLECCPCAGSPSYQCTNFQKQAPYRHETYLRNKI
jgi:hypothetical protein